MDADTSPLSDRYSIDTIIAGLAQDLDDLRSGKITARQAKASADLAHEIMRGIDLVVRAQKMLGDRAKAIGDQTHD